ncbi:hypothetical protein PIB30_035799 [Stylosanthes scabra]|uniref:RNase H type-1 domain-containing protein n=1 Tax=Stylosanthes scabra TaxID=79078 RepID=A0ABU6WBN0_9FABA|nr:hypothetical protein [Stylosanthes scabra]
MLKALTEDRRMFFLCRLYSILQGRNKVIFEHLESPLEIVLVPPTSCKGNAADFQNCVHCEPSLGSQRPNFWSAPSPGTYKMNVNAIMINGRRGGVSVVVRNWEGAIMATATLEICSSLSVKEAEEMTVFFGLQLAAQWCFLNIEIEWDSWGVHEAM